MGENLWMTCFPVHLTFKPEVRSCCRDFGYQCKKWGDNVTGNRYLRKISSGGDNSDFRKDNIARDKVPSIIMTFKFYVRFLWHKISSFFFLFFLIFSRVDFIRFFKLSLSVLVEIENEYSVITWTSSVLIQFYCGSVFFFL